MQEGGGGGEEALHHLHAAACLQSCSLSPGQKIVLLHNPGVKNINGTRIWQTSQPARHVVHVRRCVRKLDCAPKCVREVHVCLIYTCVHTLFPAELSSLPLLHSFALGRRHHAKLPQSARLEQDETYAPPSCTEQPLSNMERTWVYVTCMMRPLPLG